MGQVFGPLEIAFDVGARMVQDHHLPDVVAAVCQMDAKAEVSIVMRVISREGYPPTITQFHNAATLCRKVASKISAQGLNKPMVRVTGCSKGLAKKVAAAMEDAMHQSKLTLGN